MLSLDHTFVPYVVFRSVFVLAYGRSMYVGVLTYALTWNWKLTPGDWKHSLDVNKP